MAEPPAGPDWIALFDAPLPLDDLNRWAVVPRAGAVVSFTGVVRDHAEGRSGVVAMTYEAYRDPAVRVLGEVVAELRRRWPDAERVALVHRVGAMMLGEASVAVVVSAPHRDVAFEAARFGIDAVKESAPIWKQESWAGGQDWALGARDIQPVSEVGR